MAAHRWPKLESHPPQSCEVTLYWLILTTTVCSVCAPAWWHTGKVCQILKDNSGHGVIHKHSLDRNPLKLKKKKKKENIGLGLNSGAGAFTELLSGLAWRLLKSQPGKFVEKNVISSNMVIVSDVTLLLRNWAVNKLMDVLMENICSNKVTATAAGCVLLHASSFPHKTAVLWICLLV